MRRLPLELIQEIFIKSKRTCFDEHLSSWMWRFELPWELSQVCRSWRTIALAIPGLWRQIPSLDLKESKTRTGAYLNYLTEILNRSKGVPIDVHINARSPADLPHPVISTLLQHSDRWGMLRLEACHAIMPLLQPAKGRLTSLQKLTLVFRWDRELQPGPSHNLFQDAPALQDVYLENRVGDFDLPTRQLISYQQNTYRTKRLSEVLTSSMMSLTTLTLQEISATGWFPSISLPYLAFLDISHNLGDTSFGWFLDTVTLPALRTLSICHNTGDVVKSVLQMISRSGSPCKLELLVFSPKSYPSVSLTTLLAQTPLLKYLSVPLPPISDIHALIFDSNRPVLLPLLRELSFSVTAITEEFKDILITLVSSRSRPQPPLPGGEGCLSMHSVNQLDKLSLTFPDTEIAEKHLYQLENWKESVACIELRRVETLLSSMLPKIYRRWPNPLQSLFDSGSDVKQEARVRSLLDDIETLVVEDPRDLAMSGIHTPLLHLAHPFYENGQSAVLNKQAQRILLRWEPMFKLGIECKQWTMCFGTLVHLTKGGPRPVYLAKSTSTWPSDDSYGVMYGKYYKLL